MSFIQTILDATQDVESPRIYFYWAGVSAISAVMSKKVWINRQNKYKLYPNTYVFLVSKTSGLKKSMPVTLAAKLCYQLGTVRIIDGQNSIQGVIKELAQAHTTDQKCLIANAEGFLVAPEFADFLIMDRDATPLTTLTNMYDTHNHEAGFGKRLASQDKIILKGLCLNGLFASNEVHFRNAVPDNAMRGGFLARCFVAYAEVRQNINSLMGLTEEEDLNIIPIPYIELLNHLSLIDKLEGEFKISIPARKYYNEWYHEFVRKDIEDETGTFERIGDSMLKAAMCIAVSNEPELMINFEDMEEAIISTSNCFLSVRKLAFVGKQGDVKAQVLRIVMEMLLIPPTYSCTRRRLVSKGLGIFDTYELDNAINNLVEAQMISVLKTKGDFTYTLKQWVIDRNSKLESSATNG